MTTLPTLLIIALIVALAAYALPKVLPILLLLLIGVGVAVLSLLIGLLALWEKLAWHIPGYRRLHNRLGKARRIRRYKNRDKRMEKTRRRLRR